ncbi:MAG TPA: hypothetical protein VFK31_01760 [Rhodanobacteraceae bacterium]|nr:hypothetical protein [Rhodanobacteraceae bacterium]
MSGHRAELEKILNDFWVSNEIQMEDTPTSTDQLGAAMDSITAVEVLIEVDKLFNCTVPVEAVIQRGGYKDKEEFVSKLRDQILKAVEGAEP